MNKWEHLLYGEYAEKQRILSGLSLEQVRLKLSEQTHSIFEELWHTVLWQDILVNRDEQLFEKRWQAGERYPSAPPAHLETWTALVAAFMAGLEKALDWTTSPEKLGLETDPGSSMADVLHGLAVHNAYHLGKIVALRQVMGLWPA